MSSSCPRIIKIRPRRWSIKRFSSPPRHAPPDAANGCKQLPMPAGSACRQSAATGKQDAGRASAPLPPTRRSTPRSGQYSKSCSVCGTFRSEQRAKHNPVAWRPLLQTMRHTYVSSATAGASCVKPLSPMASLASVKWRRLRQRRPTVSKKPSVSKNRPVTSKDCSVGP